MPNLNKTKDEEKSSTEPSPEVERPSGPGSSSRDAVKSIPGPSSSRDAVKSIPGPSSSRDAVPSIPGPSSSRASRDAVPSIPGPSSSRASKFTVPIIPGPSSSKASRDAAPSIPGTSGSKPASIPPPESVRKSTSCQLPSVAGPPGRTSDQTPIGLGEYNEMRRSDDTMATATPGDINRRSSRSLLKIVKRFFSRRLNPRIGRHRNREDSRMIFDDNDDDEERERAPPPPPPPAEPENFREFPTETYNYFFRHDPILDMKEVEDVCTQTGRTFEDKPHLKSVEVDMSDKDISSIADFEADFETNFGSMADLARIPDLERDPVAEDVGGRADPVAEDLARVGDLKVEDVEERADPVVEDIESIADRVAEDISEHMKNKVCQRGNPF